MKLIKGHEEMRKYGFTTFQRHPNRVKILVKLLKYGKVMTRIKKSNIKLEITDFNVNKIRNRIKMN